MEKEKLTPMEAFEASPIRQAQKAGESLHEIGRAIMESLTGTQPLKWFSQLSTDGQYLALLLTGTALIAIFILGIIFHF